MVARSLVRVRVPIGSEKLSPNFIFFHKIETPGQYKKRYTQAIFHHFVHCWIELILRLYLPKIRTFQCSTRLVIGHFFITIDSFTFAQSSSSSFFLLLVLIRKFCVIVVVTPRYFQDDTSPILTCAYTEHICRENWHFRWHSSNRSYYLLEKSRAEERNCPQLRKRKGLPERKKDRKQRSRVCICIY